MLNTFQNTPLRVVPLARCILLKLYVEHVNDSPKDRYTVDDVRALFAISVSRNLVDSALRLLHGEYRGRPISRRGSAKEGGSGYYLTADGIQSVERALRDKASDMSYFLANGDKSLSDIAGFDGIFWFRDEMADIAEWKQIEFDQESQSYRDAISAVDEAILAVENSNEIQISHPEEKTGLLHALRSGLDFLRSRSATRAQISDLLIKPLKWISSTFANSFVGQVAKTAAQKVVDLLLSAL